MQKEILSLDVKTSYYHNQDIFHCIESKLFRKSTIKKIITKLEQLDFFQKVVKKMKQSKNTDLENQLNLELFIKKIKSLEFKQNSIVVSKGKNYFFIFQMSIKKVFI